MSSSAKAATAGESRAEAILAAGQTIFIHYGFSRASLDLIAREAGISRTGLYHHFRSKEDVFRAVVVGLHDFALAAAEAGAAREGSLQDRLLRVLRAKLGWFYAQLAETRHGNEILDQSNRLCGDAIAKGARRYHRLVSGLLRAADRNKAIDLRASGLSIDAAATLIINSAYGLQGQSGGDLPTPARVRAALEAVGAGHGCRLGQRPKTSPVPFVDRDGVRIHFEDQGDGPPVLLTHGFTSTAHMWEPQVTASVRSLPLPTLGYARPRPF